MRQYTGQRGQYAAKFGLEKAKATGRNVGGLLGYDHRYGYFFDIWDNKPEAVNCDRRHNKKLAPRLVIA